MSYAKSSFDWFFVHHLGNSKYFPFQIDAGNVEFRSVFRTPSQKFKILAIPNVLAHRKSYEYGFTKKCDGHKLFTKSTFNQFFMHPLGNSKYWLFQTHKLYANSGFDRFFGHRLRNS
ncbi:hypothetical protein B296_00049989 [Ensete ventricosum]|uniref:Uncharacterized protein n=1 Tax=Ensete ventricosum TaxID=4639 RepID=A0A426XCB0_ENSVE|nr:hypothetical protein B296_00049989 [Ensete ventricosum]